MKHKLINRTSSQPKKLSTEITDSLREFINLHNMKNSKVAWKISGTDGAIFVCDLSISDNVPICFALNIEKASAAL